MIFFLDYYCFAYNFPVTSSSEFRHPKESTTKNPNLRFSFFFVELLQTTIPFFTFICFILVGKTIYGKTFISFQLWPATKSLLYPAPFIHEQHTKITHVLLSSSLFRSNIAKPKKPSVLISSQYNKKTPPNNNHAPPFSLVSFNFLFSSIATSRRNKQTAKQQPKPAKNTHFSNQKDPNTPF